MRHPLRAQGAVSRSRTRLPRASFPLAFAALAACIGPGGEGVVESSAAALTEPPEDWDVGRIVDMGANDHPGWTRGLFAVTADGTATYDVPLWAPPGRAGIEPHLSLHYSSRAGESNVGQGWSVSGLSSITRCGRTRSIDGDQLGPVRWDQQVFCLDGHRLISLDATHFRPLQNGTERVTSEGADVTNPTGFTVEHEDGVSYQYERLVQAPGCRPGTADPYSVEPDGSTRTYAWLLTRVGDLAGNFMTIDYTQIDHAGTEDTPGSPLDLLAAVGCPATEWVPHRMVVPRAS